MEEIKIVEMTTTQCIGYIGEQFGAINGTGLEHESRMTVLRRLAYLCNDQAKMPVKTEESSD